MKTISCLPFIAQTREKFPAAAKRIAVIFIVLAGLRVPCMLSVSHADNTGKAAIMPLETGPDYRAGKLVGTMLSSGLSGAVFENAAGEQKFYRKGVTFSDGSRIVSVYSESIVVKTPEGTSVEYLVTRGTSGRSGTAPASLPAPAVETPSYSGSQDQDESEIRKTLRGKRRRVHNNENE